MLFDSPPKPDLLVDGRLQPCLVYLAGGMTGLPEHNFPLFHRAAGELRANGFSVGNPAENPFSEEGRPFYMRLDIQHIIGTESTDPVDAVVVLPDWHLSRGARLEVEIALQLAIPVCWAHNLKPLIRADYDLARIFLHPEAFYPNYEGVAA